MSVLKVLQIERKFGASLGEILNKMVNDGLSVRQMSEQTTFAPQVIYRMLEKLGLRNLASNDPERVTAARKAAMARVGESTAKYRVEWRGVEASVYRHCGTHGLSMNRVYRAIGRGATPVEALEMAVGGGE